VRSYRAGAMRQQVTLQAPPAPGAEEFDTFGQPVPDWTTVGVFSAQVRPLSGREAVSARQIKAEATHAIVMRFLGPDVAVNPTCRLLYGTRTFGIIQVVNAEERDRWYEIIAQEIQTTGQV
jgi:SPP1 family predicted phage head-tail adaptor